MYDKEYLEQQALEQWLKECEDKFRWSGAVDDDDAEIAINWSDYSNE